MRLNIIESYEDKVRALAMTEDYTKVLAISHKGEKGENPHYHITFLTNVKPKAFRARMVKTFDLGKGNQHMSIKEWDGKDEANAYMFHEKGYRMILNKGYSEDDILRFIKINEEVTKKVEKAKEKASWKLEEILVNKITLEVDKERIKRMTSRDIAYYVLRECFESDKYQPNDFQLKGMCDRINYKLKEPTEKEMVIHDIIGRIKWD